MRRCAFALIGAVTIAGALTACSTLRWGYNNADTLLAYGLDTYFDLDDAQTALVRDRLQSLLAWHRGTQLRGYAGLVQRAGDLVGRDLDAPTILNLQREMNARLVATGTQAAPALAALALTLTPAQIDRFERKLGEESGKAQREFARYAGTEPRALDARVKHYAESTADWFGSLSASQLEAVRAAMTDRPQMQRWWFQERAQRNADMIAILRRIQTDRPDADTAASWFRAYFAQLIDPPDPERGARISAFRQANAGLIAQVINRSSPEQKAALQKKLRRYADDFSALALEVAGTNARGNEGGNEGSNARGNERRS